MFTFNKNKIVGFKLFDKGNGLWHFQSSSGIISGSLKEVCKKAHIEHGISLNELETAVLEMEINFHNAAEFGMLKSFMFSYDVEEFQPKIAN